MHWHTHTHINTRHTRYTTSIAATQVFPTTSFNMCAAPFTDICSIYMFVTIIFKYYSIHISLTTPQIVSSCELVAACSHLVRTAPADGSRPNAHRLLCRSQTGEPETDASLMVLSLPQWLRDNKFTKERLQLQSVDLSRQHERDVVDFQGGRWGRGHM